MNEYRASIYAWQELANEHIKNIRDFMINNGIDHGIDHDYEYIWMRITDDLWFMFAMTNPALASIFRRTNAKTTA